MTVLCLPSRPAQEPHEGITGFDPCSVGTRLTKAARSVDLARCNARQPKLWTLGTFDRAVTVPNRYRHAAK